MQEPVLHKAGDRATGSVATGIAAGVVGIPGGQYAVAFTFAFEEGPPSETFVVSPAAAEQIAEKLIEKAQRCRQQQPPERN